MALADRFAAELRQLLGSQAFGQGSEFWRGICGDLHRLVAEDDMRFFMRWPALRATMVHGAVAGTFRQWWALRRSSSWRAVWRPALRHPQYGHPPPFPPMLSTNAMAIEHASHLFRFEKAIGAPVQDGGCIIEFGGGFGSMCRLVRALGFRGTYIIFDLPPILALQRYYLGLHGIQADQSKMAGVQLCSDIDPIMSWIDRAQPAHISMISTWALSEMPLKVRESVASFFDLAACNKALLAYQPAFEGNDNRVYFSQLMARTADQWSWVQTPVDNPDKPPLPQDSLYVFGRRR
jgi:hypothetical protein